MPTASAQRDLSGTPNPRRWLVPAVAPTAQLMIVFDIILVNVTPGPTSVSTSVTATRSTRAASERLAESSFLNSLQKAKLIRPRGIPAGVPSMRVRLSPARAAGPGAGRVRGSGSCGSWTGQVPAGCVAAAYQSPGTADLGSASTRHRTMVPDQCDCTIGGCSVGQLPATRRWT